ncbi:MAG TPA: hypothetical protein VL092_04140 [Chitinophagaceae bacterium]|nr:hypothetical protein [Chitinophagaceae bacterium]
MNGKLPGQVVSVDVLTAAAQTANYRNFIQGNFDQIAFHIRAEDLLHALELPIQMTPEHPIQGIRVYMALEQRADGSNYSHLYVVGTTAGGDDIVQGPLGDSRVYDMTRPCPDMCSNANLLNGGVPLVDVHNVG